MNPEELEQLTQAQRVLTAAGVLLYEPAHPVSFGPQVTVSERGVPRLVLRSVGSPDGAKLEAVLDGKQIGLSTPIFATDRGLIATEVRAFLEALVPPLWPVPKPAPKVATGPRRTPKATGTLASRRAAGSAKTSSVKSARVSAPPPAQAPDFVPFVAKKNRPSAAGSTTGGQTGQSQKEA